MRMKIARWLMRAAGLKTRVNFEITINGVGDRSYVGSMQDFAILIRDELQRAEKLGP